MKISLWLVAASSLVLSSVGGCTSGSTSGADGGADAGGGLDASHTDAGGSLPDAASDAATTTDAAPSATDGGDGGGTAPGTSGVSGVKDKTLGTAGVVASALGERHILGSRAAGGNAYLFTVVLNPPTGLSSQALGVSRFDYAGKLDTAYGTSGTLLTAGGSDERYGAQPFTVDSKGRVYALSSSSDATYITKINVFRYDAKGRLDASFGTAGQLDIAQTDLTGQTGMFAAPSTIYALPNDELLLVGFIQAAMGQGSIAGRNWFVAKLHDDGSLDTAFNHTGYTLIPSGFDDAPGLIALATDGTIYVGAHRADSAQGTTISKISAAGVLDKSYGTAGFATIAANMQIKINCIAADDQGRVIGAGSFPGTGSSSTAAYATRLGTDGKVDSKFGTHGEVTIDFITLPYDSSTWLDEFHDLWLDGKQIMLAGFTESTLSGAPEWYALARLNDNGALDPGFAYTASIGRIPELSFQLGVTASAFSSVPAVRPTPDGKQIVGFGNLGGKITFVRWN